MKEVSCRFEWVVERGKGDAGRGRRLAALFVAL